MTFNALDMEGFIDTTFGPVPATRNSQSGTYVNGIYTPGTPISSPHTVNIQVMTAREMQPLTNGAERIIDVRRVYVNDGDLYSITPSDEWTFEGIDGIFECIALDNRPWYSYCRIIASRRDDSA